MEKCSLLTWTAATGNVISYSVYLELAFLPVTSVFVGNTLGAGFLSASGRSENIVTNGPYLV